MKIPVNKVTASTLLASGLIFAVGLGCRYHLAHQNAERAVIGVRTKHVSSLEELTHTPRNDSELPPYTGMKGDPIPALKKYEVQLKSEVKGAKSPDDIVRKTVPFLKVDSMVSLAVEILGDSGSGTAEKPLEQVLQSLRAGQISTPSEIKVKIALAKIKTINLRGTDKLDSFIKDLGFSWPDIVILSKKVNTVARNTWVIDSIGDDVVNSVVDVLCDLRRRRVDVEKYIGALTLNESQKIQCEAALLPARAEVNKILDYAANGEAHNLDMQKLVLSNLPKRGPVVAEVLAERLTKIKVEKIKLNYVGYYDLWYQLAVELGDPSLIPPIKALESGTHPSVTASATMARMAMEKKQL